MKSTIITTLNKLSFNENAVNFNEFINWISFGKNA
jgi:hypothetical protein